MSWMTCACGPSAGSALPFCGSSDAEQDTLPVVPVPVFALPLAELRDVGRLARMDEIASKLVPFTPALGSLVFVVHEWASARGASLSRARARDRQPRGRPRSYDAPDPSGAQFELLVSATSAAASADGKGTGTLDQCVADPRGCYLWLDAWSVPRRVGPTRAEGCPLWC